MPDSSAAAFGWVGVGACLGGMARYATSLLIAPSTAGLPWPTLIVNILGSGLAGSALAIFSRTPSPGLWQPLLVAGFLGGLTTFSAFSAENLGLIQKGRWDLMLAYALGSVTVGILAAATGHWLTQRLWPA